jgi:hypothetical protein
MIGMDIVKMIYYEIIYKEQWEVFNNHFKVILKI